MTDERAVIRHLNVVEMVCARCRYPVPPREGRLWRCWGDRAHTCRKHGHWPGGGWHVSCLDEKKCKARAPRRGDLRPPPKRPRVKHEQLKLGLEE
jgi:hypothetical protein